MATIIDDVSLATAVTSTAVTNPNNVRIQFEVSGATDEKMIALVTYLVNDGTQDVALTDEDNAIVEHKITGNGAISKNLLVVNSASLKAKVSPVGTHDGNVTATTFES